MAEIIANGGIRHGTYHQCYRLDNTLIAVGVVDILPSGQSVTDLLPIYFMKYNKASVDKSFKSVSWTYYRQVSQSVTDLLPIYFMKYNKASVDKSFKSMSCLYLPVNRL